MLLQLSVEKTKIKKKRPRMPILKNVVENTK